MAQLGGQGERGPVVKAICRHGVGRPEELRGSRVFPFGAALSSPPSEARYQTRAEKGERGENNYPLPQPAGLFINTQL